MDKIKLWAFGNLENENMFFLMCRFLPKKCQKKNWASRKQEWWPFTIVHPEWFDASKQEKLSEAPVSVLEEQQPVQEPGPEPQLVPVRASLEVEKSCDIETS